MNQVYKVLYQKPKHKRFRSSPWRVCTEKGIYLRDRDETTSFDLKALKTLKKKRDRDMEADQSVREDNYEALFSKDFQNFSTSPSTALVKMRENASKAREYLRLRTSIEQSISGPDSGPDVSKAG